MHAAKEMRAYYDMSVKKSAILLKYGIIDSFGIYVAA